MDWTGGRLRHVKRYGGRARTKRQSLALNIQSKPQTRQTAWSPIRILRDKGDASEHNDPKRSNSIDVREPTTKRQQSIEGFNSTADLADCLIPLRAHSDERRRLEEDGKDNTTSSTRAPLRDARNTAPSVTLSSVCNEEEAAQITADSRKYDRQYLQHNDVVVQCKVPGHTECSTSISAEAFRVADLDSKRIVLLQRQNWLSGVFQLKPYQFQLALHEQQLQQNFCPGRIAQAGLTHRNRGGNERRQQQLHEYKIRNAEEVCAKRQKISHVCSRGGLDRRPKPAQDRSSTCTRQMENCNPTVCTPSTLGNMVKLTQSTMSTAPMLLDEIEGALGGLNSNFRLPTSLQLPVTCPSSQVHELRSKTQDSLSGSVGALNHRARESSTNIQWIQKPRFDSAQDVREADADDRGSHISQKFSISTLLSHLAACGGATPCFSSAVEENVDACRDSKTSHAVTQQRRNLRLALSRPVYNPIHANASDHPRTNGRQVLTDERHHLGNASIGGRFDFSEPHSVVRKLPSDVDSMAKRTCDQQPPDTVFKGWPLFDTTHCSPQRSYRGPHISHGSIGCAAGSKLRQVGCHKGGNNTISDFETFQDIGPSLKEQAFRAASSGSQVSDSMSFKTLSQQVRPLKDPVPPSPDTRAKARIPQKATFHRPPRFTTESTVAGALTLSRLAKNNRSSTVELGAKGEKQAIARYRSGILWEAESDIESALSQ